MENIFHANSKHERTGITILISGKVYLRHYMLLETKKYFIMINDYRSERYNNYTYLNNRAPKFM